MTVTISLVNPLKFPKLLNLTRLEIPSPIRISAR